MVKKAKQKKSQKSKIRVKRRGRHTTLRKKRVSRRPVKKVKKRSKKVKTRKTARAVKKLKPKLKKRKASIGRKSRKVSFVESKQGREVKKSLKKKLASKRKKTTRKPFLRSNYTVNRGFELYEELKNLLIKASPSTFPKLIEGLKKVGKIKLVVVTGVFFNLENSRIDLLVVGDDISLPKFMNVIKDMEADAGKELRYVILGTDEFIYRYEMFDRFLRDIIDSPHQKIINRIKF